MTTVESLQAQLNKIRYKGQLPGTDLQNKTPRNAIVCPIRGCKRLATLQTTVDNKKYYYCERHGFTKSAEEPKSYE